MANLIPYLVYLIIIIVMGVVIVVMCSGMAQLIAGAHPPFPALPWLIVTVMSASLASLSYVTYYPESSSIFMIGGSPEQYVRGWPLAWYGRQGLGSFFWILFLFGDLFLWIISIGVVYRGSAWLIGRAVPPAYHQLGGVLSWLIITVSAYALPFLFPPF